MNRIDKLYRYHSDNGLWRTLVWIAEHFARRRLAGAGTSTPHESLATHWVDATAGVATNGPTLDIAPGAAAIQDLCLPFHTILSVRVEIDRASNHDDGKIALLDSGTEIHSETVRARTGSHTLNLPETGVRAPQGRVALRLMHAGRRGVLRVRLNASGQFAIRVGGRAPDAIAHYPGAPQRALPKVSVVTAFGSDSATRPAVLDSYRRQAYEGGLEFVSVDIGSAGGSAETVGAALNRGIASASGDVIVVMDGRQAMGADFVRAHVQAHSYGDCDAVIGSVAQNDASNPGSFLNTRCGNFSIRSSALDGPLFDDDARDFPWAGIEMGYRLYRRGLRVKYTSDAVSAGPASAPGPQGARWFLERHPDAAEEGGAALRALAAPPAPRSARKLRVLTYRWHVAHQYELYKLGHDFDLIADLPTQLTNRWDLRQRPLPENARFIPRAAAKPADYDLAILHFDENVLSPENSNGVLGPYWGHAFRYLMEEGDVPKIAVCHGTPQFHGQYTPGYDKADLLQVIEPARRELVEYLKDTLVICNSHQAQAEWGFRRSKVIWHGFDPLEFPPACYEKGILSPLGPAVTARPHYRGYYLYQQVFADFPAQYAPSTLYVPDPSPLYAGNTFATWKFRNYVDEIRRYSVYFNPTRRSPMPRARGEAMTCGLVTVSADNHDVDRFIRNGVNGFYAREPGELREHLLYLCRNPDAARRIGGEGRRTALKAFHLDRYLADWRETIAQET